MAMTVTRGLDAIQAVDGKDYRCLGTLTFDASYPTGGEVFTKESMGFAHKITRLIIQPKSGYVLVPDLTNLKVLAYFADYDAVADGALTEVADTTDLSALTGVPFEAYGW